MTQHYQQHSRRPTARRAKSNEIISVGAIVEGYIKPLRGFRCTLLCTVSFCRANDKEEEEEDVDDGRELQRRRRRRWWGGAGLSPLIVQAAISDVVSIYWALCSAVPAQCSSGGRGGDGYIFADVMDSNRAASRARRLNTLITRPATSLVVSCSCALLLLF